MKSINDIFRDIASDTAKEYGSNVSYMFGDWGYIAAELTKWSDSPKTSMLKFPIICLYSPYTEDRMSKDHTASLEFIIMKDTLKEYTNEDREKISFEKVLRPIYDIFIKKISESFYLNIDYDGAIPHLYSENYRYGRKGVEAEGKPFIDFIDAIEIKNLKVKIKNTKCYGSRI